MSQSKENNISIETFPVPGALGITLCEEKFYLLPQKAMYWPKFSTLFLADAHFGKAGTFRSQKIAIPSGITETDLSKIDFLVEQLSAKKLIFLGDFIHAKSGMTKRITEQLLQWRKNHSTLSVSLVKGNHDRSIKGIAELLQIELLNEPYLMSPFILCHHPDVAHVAKGLVLCGHLHPAVKLFGQARQKVRLPCFYVQEKQIVLPAFGSFTGCMEIIPLQNEQIYVIAESEVVKVR